MGDTSKLRTPTNQDVENASRWLREANRNLQDREYFRVKRLCNQVIRALRRKDGE